jgi:fatty-acid desaturase
MAYSIQNNAYAISEAKKIRVSSVLAIVAIFAIMVLDYLDFFKSFFVMIFVVGSFGIFILFVVFYSIMILSLILHKTFELKSPRQSQVLFYAGLFFMPLGLFLLREKS